MSCSTRTFYYMNLYYILIVLVQVLHVSLSSTIPPTTSSLDEINVPKEYEGCRCEWSEWMNSDDPNSEENDVETYDHLRDAGYSFCEEPVDLQCRIVSTQEIVEGVTLGAACLLSTGLTCNFFCDDYEVRVACCVCSPDPVGPEFLLKSYTNDGCLGASDTSVEFLDADACAMGTPNAMWAWVSDSQIINQGTEQCLAVDATDSALVTSQCDADDQQSAVSYNKDVRTLMVAGNYLDSSTATVSANADSSLDWFVEVGEDALEADLSQMKGFPCDNQPNSPNFGTTTCSTGSYLNSECYFSCDYGYHITDDEDLYPSVCGMNGKFNATAPKCRKIVCQPPLRPTEYQTITCSSNNTMDSNCLYSCDEGYALDSKDKQSICLESGEWTNYPSPRCGRKLIIYLLDGGVFVMYLF